MLRNYYNKKYNTLSIFAMFYLDKNACTVFASIKKLLDKEFIIIHLILSLVSIYHSILFAGLMYIIETQTVLDLKINLMASYIIVPQKGFYDKSANLLIVDLGNLKVSL